MSVRVHSNNPAQCGRPLAAAVDSKAKFGRSNIGRALEVFFTHAPNVMDVLTLIVKTVFPAVLDGGNTEYCTASSATFPLYFAAVYATACKQLVGLEADPSAATTTLLVR